jgi:hypothetical protein
MYIKSIRGLNLAVVKLTAVHVTQLPLQHKLDKHDLLCKAWTDKGPVYSAHGRILNNTLYVRYARAQQVKHIVKCMGDLYIILDAWICCILYILTDRDYRQYSVIVIPHTFSSPLHTH